MQEIEREPAVNDGVEVVQEQRREKNRGGAAPAHRQCRRILESGERCRDWEVRGQGFCFRHGRWEGTRRRGPITVPLMEDAGSIRLVVTQTVRAMSLGTIPPSNGRAILMGCREARGLLQDELAEKRLAVQMKRWKVVLEEPAKEPLEVVECAGEWLSPVADEKEMMRQWEEEMRAEREAREKARAAAAAAEATAEAAHAGESAEAEGAAETESAAAVEAPSGDGEVEESRPVEGEPGEAEPALSYAEWARMRREELLQARRDVDDPPQADPLWVPHAPPKFRDLKKNWDFGLKRSEMQTEDMYFKRSGETAEEYREALARPYEAYFEKDREVGNSG